MKNLRTGIMTLFVVVGAIATFQILSPKVANSDQGNDLTQDSLASEVDPETYLFGINVTGLNIVEGTVDKNQTLASILLPFNVPYQIIDEIAKKSREVFDVRWIAANKKFTILTPSDSIWTLWKYIKPRNLPNSEQNKWVVS